MAARPFCTICKVHPRSMSAHLATESHKARAYRLANPSSGRRGQSARKANRVRAIRNARRSEDNYLRRTLARVRTYRRSRPNDGTRRVVKVRPYYRHKPGRLFRALEQATSGVWYSFGIGIDGAVRTMRRATRAELREAGKL